MWRDMKCWRVLKQVPKQVPAKWPASLWLSQCLLPLPPLPPRQVFAHSQGFTCWALCTGAFKKVSKRHHKAHLWRWVWSKLHHLANGYKWIISASAWYALHLQRLQGGSKIKAACSTSLTHHVRRSRYRIGRVQVRYASGTVNLCHSCILLLEVWWELSSASG